MTQHLEPTKYMTPEEFARQDGKPGLRMRVNSLAPDLREIVKREIDHLNRVRHGERARPDLMPDSGAIRRGQSTSPGNDVRSREAPRGYPTPFAPRDELRPDVDRKTANELMGRAAQYETEEITAGICDRMGTDADRELPPVTLRDQLEAAYSVHAKE